MWAPEDLSEKLSRALQSPVIATFGNTHLVPGAGESSLLSTQHQIIVGLLTKFSLEQDFYQSAMVETFRPCAYLPSVQNHKRKYHLTHGAHRHGEGITQLHTDGGFKLPNFRCLRCQRPNMRWGSKLHGSSTRWWRLGRESPGQMPASC